MFKTKRYQVLFLLVSILYFRPVLGQIDDPDLNDGQIYDYGKVKTPTPTVGLLYPRESETREVRSLDGIWRFLKSNASDPLRGVREKWFDKSLSKTGFNLIPMPVPASYNDITVDKEMRDHVGTVWYERTFFVPNSWQKDRRTWLRFGSVHYHALVWLNGHLVMNHSIGHLPFEEDISKFVNFGLENRVTVMCDNRLDNHTIPQGQVHNVTTDDGITQIQGYTFDFFNYAGIHRSVYLYTTSLTHIRDIEIKTQISVDGMGRIDYRLWVERVNATNGISLKVRLLDGDGEMVAHQKNREINHGTLLVPNVKPWWPYLMHPQPGYLYTVEFHITQYTPDKEILLDVYRLPVGIRNLSWDNTTFLINDLPIYLRGFGKHEDSDIRGKGLDNPLIARDFNLLKWIGANAYRTSHYPYSEESMQFADEQGILIIDECSAVNIDLFNPQLLANHMSAIEQLIHRDRNHASAIIWSIANEPRSYKKGAEAYFGAIANYTRSIAQGRPLTAAINSDPKLCQLSQFLDIIGFNRYNAWYQNPGRTDMIVKQLEEEAMACHQRFQKPVIMFEYGADTMEGMHSLPAFIWSEDYQVVLLNKHFEVFDKLHALKWFRGEFVWNFADFKTDQSITRVGGNKKGIFTRDRQPKMVAHLLRLRYWTLARKLNNCPLPKDLLTYFKPSLGHDASEL
ncbi:uncharacterized protein Dwil_GK17842 [Drosophila willistoni]|uniref:Beta-glucuronidase n=1 Tax=Drosophila willistoni TaxID=7260 RepID=B4N5Y2_DROWI|nr:beta-glucuronidase [Drosophila willistoni]EDW79771.1 uncharacterized protein Dwil_GK17842 [Drosophila willistoni]